MEVMPIAGLTDLYNFFEGSRGTTTGREFMSNTSSSRAPAAARPPQAEKCEDFRSTTTSLQSLLAANKNNNRGQQQMPWGSSSLTRVTGTPTQNQQGLYLPPPNEPGEEFVNVYMLIDPRTMTCTVPKQIISYKQQNRCVLSTAVFGPKVLKVPSSKTNTTSSSTTASPSSSHTTLGAGPQVSLHHQSSRTTEAPTTTQQLCSSSTQVSFPLFETYKNFVSDASSAGVSSSDTSTAADTSQDTPMAAWQSSTTTSSTVSNDEKQEEESQVPFPTTSSSSQSSGISSKAVLPPLRALSAYNFFFRDERERVLSNVGPDWSEEKKQKLLEEHWFQDRNKKRRHRKTHGKIDFTTLSKLISARWKELPEEHKDFYRQIASRDFERFKREAREQQQQEYSLLLPPSSVGAPSYLMNTLQSHTSVVG